MNKKVNCEFFVSKSRPENACENRWTQPYRVGDLLLLVVERAVVARVEVVEVGGNLGLEFILYQKGVHASVEEPRPEAVVPIWKFETDFTIDI